MAESSRDTTQLIRLVYTSVCRGLGWSEEQCIEIRRRKTRKELFSSFWKFSLLFAFIDWVASEGYFKKKEKNLTYSFESLNDSIHFVTRGQLGKASTFITAWHFTHSTNHHLGECEIKVIWSCTHSKWPTGIIMLFWTSSSPEESC